MLNKQDDLVRRLNTLGLSSDEAKVYLELLKGPSSHLRLSHATGINRTKVYRLADQLEKRSLITTRTDDRGSFLVASDPSTLEVALVLQEEKVAHQRKTYSALLPQLMAVQQHDTSSLVVHTYDGEEGFKQMLWHELKAEGEMVIFGSGTIEDLVQDRVWAEKHRAMTVEAGYTIRELLNPGDKDKPFTLHEDFMARYTHRTIPREVLLLKNQISIYNDTVATYHWRDNQRVGLEVINHNYAAMMRQVFDAYWGQSTRHTPLLPRKQFTS